MNLRKKCALDCLRITNPQFPGSLVDSRLFLALKRKDVGSSQVAFKFVFFSFVFLGDLLVSSSLFLILCTTGYIYLNLACGYVTNTAP